MNGPGRHGASPPPPGGRIRRGGPRSRSWLATAGAVLLAVGCAGPRPFTCEARGGPAWREYRTQHFELFTDAARADVEATADLLELVRAQLVEGMTSKPVDIPGRLRVVLLEDERDFRALAGPHLGGYFTEQLGEPVVVLPVGGAVRWPEIIAHELAHYLSRYLFPVQPHWFAEGLAGYMETVGSADPRYRGRIGAVTAERARSLSETSLPPAETLLRWSGEVDDGRPGLMHAASWLLYGMLWNAHSARFSSYQAALSLGADPDVAWREAFPEFALGNEARMARLDAALHDYLRRGTFRSYLVKAVARAELTEVGRVPPADVHMLLLSVSRGPARPGAAAAQLVIEEAMREDPLQPLGIMQGGRSAAERKRALRQSTAAAPRRAIGWLLLGEALTAPEEAAEREAALRKALELEPDSGLASAGLAAHLLATGRPGEALPLADRAAQAAPWRPTYLFLLAAAEAELGHCGLARGWMERAVRLAASEKVRRGVVPWAAAGLRSRCGEGP